MSFSLSIISFTDHAMPRSIIFSSMLSSRNFIALHFTFKSMMHFELIFYNKCKVYARLIFLQVDVQLFQPCLLKRLCSIKLPLPLCHLDYVCMLLSHFSRVWLFVVLWTVARQAPISVYFFRQEYWSGLPFSSPLDLPNPGIKPMSSALAGGFFTTSTTWEAPMTMLMRGYLWALHSVPWIYLSILLPVSHCVLINVALQ